MKMVIDITEEAYNLLQNEGVDWLGAGHILDRVANGRPLSKVVENIKTEIKEEIDQTWYTKDSYQEGYKDGLLKANEYIDKYISEEESDAE